MKRIALVLLASAAALAANSARADHVSVRGSISIGAPAYVTPVYGYHHSDGFWQDVSTRVWIPAHWEVSRDYYGRAFNRWEPGHYELRTQRVWVDARRNRERWEHERWEHARREREEHERREHGFDRGWRR